MSADLSGTMVWSKVIASVNTNAQVGMTTRLNLHTSKHTHLQITAWWPSGLRALIKEGIQFLTAILHIGTATNKFLTCTGKILGTI